eukprot:scaffold82269_cov40-Attheya_sp.AAC.2
MPIRVTFRVKRGSSLPIHKRAKKQRMTNLPRIRVKSETVNTAEEVTVKREEIDDGSVASDHSASESALPEPSSDPHLSHKPSTSSTKGSTTSKQCTSQVGTSYNAEICAFESILESDLNSLSNQESENLPMNNGFSELQSEEEVAYDEVAQSSIAHGSATIPFVLNNKKKRNCPSWDEKFKELMDFKKITGHTNVPRGSGPLGRWVDRQRTQYHLWKEGKHSRLTNERREKLESIGFTFTCRPSPTITPWDQRLQELVDFKKIKGHTNVRQESGPIGTWVNTQRRQYHLWKEGKHSQLTNERREKLESIGFTFTCRPSPTITPWDQRFQELVDFKKIKGHTNVRQGSGPLGRWVNTQRRQYHLWKEGKHSQLTNERREKLESIGFRFNMCIKKS